MTTFDDLGLGDDILKAIKDIGYTTPTPIQEQAIPYILQMRDVLGCAQTGTGKTGGFTLPMIEILASGRARARMPRSLILEPTRELAAQVAENFELYGKYHKLNMALLIGGETMSEQISNLDRGADVLIATPGRMIDLYERGKVLLNDIKIFVIDEADRMLDMGFIPDIEKIAKLLPVMRQTLFFSATMPPEIRKLADRFLQNPKSISVSPPASTAVNIDQRLVVLPTDNDWQKREALRMLIRRENVQNAFIFCNRKRDVALLEKSLKKHGFNAGCLHGDMEQSERVAMLDKFKQNEVSLLVCSDVAARGLDVPDVSHVFNFDVPFSAEDYVHRIGRTGRAGCKGASYTLSTPEEGNLVDAIEVLIKKTIERESLENLPTADESRGRSRPNKFSKGRPSKRPYDRGHERDRHGSHQKKPALPKEQSVISPSAEPVHLSAPRKTEKAPHAGDAWEVPAFLRRPVVRGK